MSHQSEIVDPEAKWRPNIERLQGIENLDPVFWENLVELARGLEKFNHHYIDDHRLPNLGFFRPDDVKGDSLGPFDFYSLAHPDDYEVEGAPLGTPNDGKSDMTQLDKAGYIRKIEGIGICQTYRLNGELLPIPENPEDPRNRGYLAWAFPALFFDKTYTEWERSAQCKNPLYFDAKRRLRLTCSSSGSTLGRLDIAQILAGDLAVQELGYVALIEKNFALPVSLFIESMNVKTKLA